MTIEITNEGDQDKEKIEEMVKDKKENNIVGIDDNFYYISLTNQRSNFLL